MNFKIALITTTALVLLSSVTHSAIMTDEQSCEKGHEFFCEKIELQKRIEEHFDTSAEGEYKWTMTVSFLDELIASGWKERAAMTVQRACTGLAEVTHTHDLARYSREHGTTIIRKKRYKECFDLLIEDARREEQAQLAWRMVNTLKWPLMILLGITALWYRRPLLRCTKHIFSTINQLGAK